MHNDAMEYKPINSDEQMAGLRAHFYNSNITKIAMDFEGDFGTYSYGNKLCLIQVYDKKMFYIIDPFKISSEEMIKFFADKKIIKYMYGAGSDIKLIYDQYKIKIQSVYDLQLLVDVLDVSPKSLDMVVRNILNIDLNYDKKKYQMYNWAKRPLPKDTVEYALSDVKYLFDLHDTLRNRINAENLIDSLIEKMIKTDYDFELRDNMPALFKSKPYQGLSENKKVLLKAIYDIREETGKKYDIPSSQIISREDMFKLTDDINLINRLKFNRRITENIKNEIVGQIKEKTSVHA
jgi:ribonuclease D